jgi:phosphoribosylformylglycinamidine synthase
MMAALADMIPGAQDWPRFTRNRSEQYESRLAMAEVLDSPSVFFAGMAGARLPIAVAHGEGFANFGHQGNAEQVRVAMAFVDHQGHRTEAYPANPNGSADGLTAVTTADGRFTAMMPHPERVTRNVAMSWHPARWGAADQGGDTASHGGYTPWMRMFRNARVWVG